VRVYDLLKGKTTMCKTCSSSASRSAGPAISESTEYNTWVHINQRCHNEANKDYKNYGGRGIHVYPLWRDSYEAFYMYLGKKPAPDYTIERIDVNKGYEPGNVTWATRDEQARNKRSNVRVTINGVEKTVVEWSEDTDLVSVPIKTIYKRIERGWDAEDAILTPVGEKQGWLKACRKWGLDPNLPTIHKP